jgi:hypothetical protein
MQAPRRSTMPGELLVRKGLCTPCRCVIVVASVAAVKVERHAAG